MGCLTVLCKSCIFRDDCHSKKTKCDDYFPADEEVLFMEYEKEKREEYFREWLEFAEEMSELTDEYGFRL